MASDGESIGVIGVSRMVVGSFPENQVTLLQTFADQAIIAIENVRLFKELETRNRALTETLEQRTATSDCRIRCWTFDGRSGGAILRRVEHTSKLGEWPAEERPRERLYHKGAGALSDGELLAIQLGTGIRGLSALDVAHGLLAQFGTLQELAGREVAEVAAVRGVGRAKAVRLASAFEITRRLRSRNGHARPILSSPEQVFARYAPLMEDLRKEIFRLALLDSQNGLLRDIVVSEGTLSASLVHPREVFKPAIIESAASIILLHNHPSGDPTPSREDLRLTRQLVECSKLLDLRIHDHVIIGRERFISLAQRGNL